MIAFVHLKHILPVGDSCRDKHKLICWEKTWSLCAVSTFKKCKAQYHVCKVSRIYLQRSLAILQLSKLLKLEKLCRVI